MFTDEKGYARSIPLPYGTYVVRETTSKHNYAPVDDFIVKITENHPRNGEKKRTDLRRQNDCNTGGGIGHRKNEVKSWQKFIDICQFYLSRQVVCTPYNDTITTDFEV